MNAPASQPCASPSPSLVADFLLVESRERGEILTNLKLQKLLYYAQAWFLVDNGVPGLFEEDFQAWVHGPVLPSQYHRFSSNEWRPILDDVQKPCLADPIVEHLKKITDLFGSETAVALELMTHRETPWLAARGDIPEDERSNAPISKESMRQYYSSL